MAIITLKQGTVVDITHASGCSPPYVCCLALQALAAEEAAAAAEQQRQADESARRLQVRAAKAALVSPEVPVDSSEPHTSLLFRLPDGSKLSRRFRLQQQVQELFHFLDSEVGGWGAGTHSLQHCL